MECCCVTVSEMRQNNVPLREATFKYSLYKTFAYENAQCVRVSAPRKHEKGCGCNS